ncbi:hypothetical protein OPT61_g10113 [Boeremia exigua]|uniref:Uncharacterized protein n=1 Tax=Boeremia exigua TaxID=749465 RepID=A0ACC2HS02_9PLEO|nr:hypothetical protein OPT61_g10113 [Boeremia exigua]
MTAGPYWLRTLLTALCITGTVAQDVIATDPSTSATAALSSPAPTIRESSSSTSSSLPQTHTIQVGLLDHKMRPDTTKAAVGDIIEFDFYPVNHSIVRAEYGFPCIPYEMTGSGKKGFFSGFNPVDGVVENPPKYSIRINDTEPIFFYCSAPGSCITWGMVGGINLNSSMSIDKQRALAMDSAYMLQPGELHQPTTQKKLLTGFQANRSPPSLPSRPSTQLPLLLRTCLRRPTQPPRPPPKSTQPAA